MLDVLVRLYAPQCGTTLPAQPYLALTPKALTNSSPG